MTDFDDYRARMQAENEERDKIAAGLRDEVVMLRNWLAAFLAPPRNFGAKKGLVEEVRLYLEGWGK